MVHLTLDVSSNIQPSYIRLEFRSFAGLAVPGQVVSVLGAGSGVVDEGVVDAFFGGAGLGSAGGGEFGFGVAVVAGQVDADVPAVG